MRGLWAVMVIAAFMVCAGCKECEEVGTAFKQCFETEAQWRARLAKEEADALKASEAYCRQHPERCSTGKKISKEESEKQMREYLEERAAHDRRMTEIALSYRG